MKIQFLFGVTRAPVFEPQNCNLSNKSEYNLQYMRAKTEAAPPLQSISGLLSDRPDRPSSFLGFFVKVAALRTYLMMSTLHSNARKLHEATVNDSWKMAQSMGMGANEVKFSANLRRTPDNGAEKRSIIISNSALKTEKRKVQQSSSLTSFQFLRVLAVRHTTRQSCTMVRTHIYPPSYVKVE